MSDIEKKANEWLAKNNGLTTLLLIGAVVAPIVWLFATQPTSSRKPEATEIRSVPESVTLKKGAVICYERDDWESFLGAAMDTNLAEIRRLLNSGKCQKVISPTSVFYLDPVRGNSALIQMPSGRGAYAVKPDIGK